MIQLTQEQCEARMLKYTREFYNTDQPNLYLDDGIWPLLAFVIRRTAEDVSVLAPTYNNRAAALNREKPGISAAAR